MGDREVKVKTLDELSVMIANAHIEPEGETIDTILDVLDELVDNMKRIEGLANHANNTASCLANGIQPD